ncbi:WHG domain-containing protein [Embleya sp. NBC_00896]|uniref:WHG domain-containing protein n=1 Tax=Embleya sp. NBC_00896 TaxID=2975961 RepID=UPI0038660DCB|nr:TetR/AcrR family transcriptional regulator [Embleya sp. NBC_00896]
MTTAPRTARDRARAELTHEIKAAARRHLAAHGAQQLSLRAVARELGMASSALYRYFPSRDDLLTALIVDAYNAVGERVERAVEAAGPAENPRAAWRGLCDAVREWAREHPHEYALIYGSPVPGYKAPEDTMAPFARVPFALLRVLRDSARDIAPPSGEAALPGPLAAQFEGVVEAAGLDVPAPVLARALFAWTGVFGIVSFELFGQLAGSADPADPFFTYAVTRHADLLGLP